jgi:penicillin amidase
VADVEKARALVASWDRVLARDSVAGAVYVRWTTTAPARRIDGAAPGDRQALVEAGLAEAVARLSSDWGADWSQWRYGRINASRFPHMFVEAFGLPAIERPGGFNTVNATGANFRRIIDLANPDRSIATNAPGQSAQPGSPYYGNLREYLASDQYFALPFTRGAVDAAAVHRLTLRPR